MKREWGVSDEKILRVCATGMNAPNRAMYLHVDDLRPKLVLRIYLWTSRFIFI